MRNPDKGQPPHWEHTTFVSPFLPPSIAAYEWRDLRLPWTRYWSVRTVSTVYSHVNSAVYLPNIHIHRASVSRRLQTTRQRARGRRGRDARVHETRLLGLSYCPPMPRRRIRAGSRSERGSLAVSPDTDGTDYASRRQPSLALLIQPGILNAGPAGSFTGARCPSGAWPLCWNAQTLSASPVKVLWPVTETEGEIRGRENCIPEPLLLPHPCGDRQPLRTQRAIGYSTRDFSSAPTLP